MDEYALYRLDWKDDQWLAHVNIPLLNKKFETEIELYSEVLGVEEAKGVPLKDPLFCTLSDITELLEAHHCEEHTRPPRQPVFRPRTGLEPEAQLLGNCVELVEACRYRDHRSLPRMVPSLTLDMKEEIASSALASQTTSVICPCISAL